MSGTLMAVLLAGLTAGAPAAEPLWVGLDVPMPKTVTHKKASMPAMARQAHIHGVVLLQITLDAAGAPSDVHIIRGMPLIMEAAVEAARKRRYEPTLVDGVARPVVFLEAFDFDEGEAAVVDVYASMTRGPGYVGGTICSIWRLQQTSPKRRKQVQAVLEPLLTDADARVAEAARRALAGLDGER